MLTFNEVLWRFQNDVISKKIKIYDYNVTYFYKKGDRKHICIEDDIKNEKLIHFTTNKPYDTLKNFIDENVIKQNKRYDSIFYNHENFLKNLDEDIVYHISHKDNHKNIMKNGLIANGDVNFDVLFASLYLDSHRPRKIPKTFFRTACIYTYPFFSFHEINLHKDECDRKNNELYAIDIKDLNWGIGSEGISGFCMCVAENEKEYNQWIHSKDLKKYASMYWKHFYMKNQYYDKNFEKEVEKSQMNYGLDELLIMKSIETNRIKHIGSFTANGFIKTNDFDSIVKDKYKSNYIEIWEKL